MEDLMYRCLRIVVAPILLVLVVEQACGQEPPYPASHERLLPKMNVTMLHGVAAPQRKSLLVSHVDGVVAKVFVAESDLVSKGAPLVLIDDRVARARVDVAKSEANRAGLLRQAELAAKLADYRLARLREAYDAGASSDTEVFVTKIQRDQAEAALQAERQHQACTF